MSIDHHAFWPLCISAIWSVIVTFKLFGFLFLGQQQPHILQEIKLQVLQQLYIIKM